MKLLFYIFALNSTIFLVKQMVATRSVDEDSGSRCHNWGPEHRPLEADRAIHDGFPYLAFPGSGSAIGGGEVRWGEGHCSERAAWAYAAPRASYAHVAHWVGFWNDVELQR